MWGRVADVQEEGTGIRGRLGDHAAGVVADGVRVVVIIPLRLDSAILDHQTVRIEVVATAGQGAIEPVEATGEGIGVSQRARIRNGVTLHGYARRRVPFACIAGLVPVIPQDLADGDAVLSKVSLVCGADFVVGDHVAHARLVGVQAGQETRTCGTAPGAVVHLREAYAVLRHCVEVRRPDLRSVAADIGEPHIIDQDDDDVGSILLRACPGVHPFPSVCGRHVPTISGLTAR